MATYKTKRCWSCQDGWCSHNREGRKKQVFLDEIQEYKTGRVKRYRYKAKKTWYD